MKFFISFYLFMMATSAFAQSLDLESFKNILRERKLSLEKVSPGMSKKISLINKIPTELGFCELNETSIQTVLKIEGEKMIIFSKEKYVPASTPSCAGFKEEEVSVLFYELKPSLASDISALDETAPQIISINKSQDIVSLLLQVSKEAVTIKYDLTKPSFKNLIFTQDSNQTINVDDMADIDVYSLDLKKVIFCESNESDNCVEGDFSDILF